MTIIPAIDLLGERNVRLKQGDYHTAEIYEKDPVNVAREFEQAGARRIHIVDLDAARGNKQVNMKKIRKIRRAVSCQLEVGGGIRGDDDIERLLDIGIDRIVVGTVFARTPELLEGWSAHYGDIFLGSIDARDGTVYIEGWEQATRSNDIGLARVAKQAGACAIVYTNILHDGMLNGLDVERANEIAAESGVPLLLSGGVSGEDDLKQLAETGHKNIAGVIVGKAIFENRLDLAHAIEVYDKKEAVLTW